MPSPAPPAPSRAPASAKPWGVTAAALAAVVAAFALLQPPGATASVPGGGRSTGAAGTGGPDAAAARYPTTCPTRSGRDAGPDVLRSGSADFDGDGTTETVALVRCPSGVGTPPSGVYVVADTGDPRPQVVETLVRPSEGMGVTDFAVRDGVVTARLLGYSSDDVPRCCPDQERRVRWDWQDDGFALHAAPPPGTV